MSQTPPLLPVAAIIGICGGVAYIWNRLTTHPKFSPTPEQANKIRELVKEAVQLFPPKGQIVEDHELKYKLHMEIIPHLKQMLFNRRLPLAEALEKWSPHGSSETKAKEILVSLVRQYKTEINSEVYFQLALIQLRREEIKGMVNDCLNFNPDFAEGIRLSGDPAVQNIVLPIIQQIAEDSRQRKL